MDRQAQMAEREARQQKIDESLVEPIWSPAIDVPLIEMSLANELPKSPIILMPELRFKSLLVRLLESFKCSGKVMIVDATNARFETLRECAQNANFNLYFSTQDVARLNYADDIFHLILTEIGLSTLSRLDEVLAAYWRVLRPEGQLIFSAPLEGSFPQFMDIFDECIFKLNREANRSQMELLADVTNPNSIMECLVQSGFDIKGHDVISCELNFQNIEQLLFSSLVESHYLGYCLNMSESGVDSKLLLTSIVRAFHHYFQGISVSVPLKLGVFSVTKMNV